MKFGLLEIGLIIAIVLVIYGVRRFSKAGQNTAPQQQRRYDPEEEEAVRNRRIALRAAQEEEDERIRQSRKVKGRMMGYILIGAGALVVLYLLFIVKWVATSPLWLWGLVIVALGFAILYLSRRN